MEVVIPKGDTILKAEDKLLIISDIRAKDEILNLLGISK
jgi:Trk K+ transport system NAD-binding subunit